jgi:hypothetical protein
MIHGTRDLQKYLSLVPWNESHEESNSSLLILSILKCVREAIEGTFAVFLLLHVEKAAVTLGFLTTSFSTNSTPKPFQGVYNKTQPSSTIYKPEIHNMSNHSFLYRVKPEFIAEGPTELSVREGDIVGTSVEMDETAGWTLVELQSPPFGRGFVPTAYLHAIPTAKKAIGHVEEPSPLPFRASTSPVGNKPISNNNAMVLRKPLEPMAKSTNQLHAQYLTQHDRQFQQVMQQRRSRMKELDEQAQDLSKHIQLSKRKAVEVSKSMQDITSVIQGERTKWKELLNEGSGQLVLH